MSFPLHQLNIQSRRQHPVMIQHFEQIHPQCSSRQLYNLLCQTHEEFSREVIWLAWWKNQIRSNGETFDMTRYSLQGLISTFWRC